MASASRPTWWVLGPDAWRAACEDPIGVSAVMVGLLDSTRRHTMVELSAAPLVEMEPLMIQRRSGMAVCSLATREGQLRTRQSAAMANLSAAQERLANAAHPAAVLPVTFRTDGDEDAGTSTAPPPSKRARREKDARGAEVEREGKGREKTPGLPRVEVALQVCCTRPRPANPACHARPCADFPHARPTDRGTTLVVRGDGGRIGCRSLQSASPGQGARWRPAHRGSRPAGVGRRRARAAGPASGSTLGADAGRELRVLIPGWLVAGEGQADA